MLRQRPWLVASLLLPSSSSWHHNSPLCSLIPLEKSISLLSLTPFKLLSLLRSHTQHTIMGKNLCWGLNFGDMILPMVLATSTYQPLMLCWFREDSPMSLSTFLSSPVQKNIGRGCQILMLSMERWAWAHGFACRWIKPTLFLATIFLIFKDQST